MSGLVLSAFLALVVCGVGVGAVPATGALPPMDLQHRAPLDQEGAFVMLWTPREKDIIVEVQVATQGYVGLGFSPNGGMKGADIIIGWVDDSGRVLLQDRHGTGNWLPPVDDTQDVVVLGGYQNDTHTVLRFSRPWNTCQPHHDFQLSGDTIRVIWAYGFEDPIDEDTIRVHSRRGTKSMYLQEPRFSLPTFTQDVSTWSIHSPNVTVPEDLSTLYWCKLFKIPPLRRKTHVIGYQPVIEERNLQHVHHILLYECHLDDAHRHYEKWLEVRGTQCYSPNMPMSWRACQTPLITWSIGSEGEMFPDHVGFPLGQEHGGSNYLLLEVHYDNPSYKKGIVDGSGLRVFHTEKLREYDAGVIQFGHIVSPLQIIPPGQNWKTIGQCSGECTRQAIPEGGVRVFQALLHTHLLGRDITLRHIRGGRELPIMFQDLNYDFNYQQTRVLKEETTILPGDEFITECGYDTRSKTKPMFGGISTEEEMCMVFASYYPRVKLEQCSSQPLLPSLLSGLGLQTYGDGKEVLWKVDFSKVEVDEEREAKDAIMMQKDGYTQKLAPTYLYQALRHLMVTSPDAVVSSSLYDILDDNTFWQDQVMVARLQEQVSYGPQKGWCLAHQLPLDGVPETYHYPDFLAIEAVDQQCEGQGHLEPPGKGVDTEVYVVESILTGGSMTSPASVTSEGAGGVTSGVGAESGGSRPQDGGAQPLLLLTSLLLSGLLLLHL